ncbi:NPCBM/NEW2 domain protein [Phycisphaerae bacterium RAS1]|nr:NPCBM/NEW2 domain protein [Phycisphaerae bacterium RAS1]
MIPIQPPGLARCVRTGACGAFALGLLAAAIARGGWPTVQLTLLDGRQVAGTLSAVAPRLELGTSSGDISFAWEQVLALQNQQPDSSAAVGSDDGLVFELSDGSVFRGRIISTTDNGVVVEFGRGATCRLDPTMCRAVRNDRAADAARAKLADLLRERREPQPAEEAPSPAEDVAVVARRSDVLVLHGGVRRLEQDGIRFTWEGQEVHLPWGRVAGLLLGRPSPRSGASLVTLRTADRFAGRPVGGDEDGLTLQSPIFERLTLAWADIERIECRSERLVYLSDLAPRRYDFEPLFGKVWPIGVDRSLFGGPLSLGGKPHLKGIALHSRCEVAYLLGGKFDQFAATVGICDDAGRRGAARLIFVGDGRVLWEGDVGGGQPPREITVDLLDVRELMIRVDYGADLDLADHVCMAQARLIR